MVNSRKCLVGFNEEWFKNKRVAIVGGADSVLAEKLGNYIDSFDVVVRVNNGVRAISTQSDYVGKRTDFLFHSFYTKKDDPGASPIELELWKQNNVGLLLYAFNGFYNYYTYTNMKKFIEDTLCKCKFSMPTLNMHTEVANEVNPSGPTTGFSAISIVLKSIPQEVYITGFTFMKTPHNSSFRNLNSQYIADITSKGHHDFDKELKCVFDAYEEKKSLIKFDRKLQEIYQNYRASETA